MKDSYLYITIVLVKKRGYEARLIHYVYTKRTYVTSYVKFFNF